MTLDEIINKYNDILNKYPSKLTLNEAKAQIDNLNKIAEDNGITFIGGIEYEEKLLYEDDSSEEHEEDSDM